MVIKPITNIAAICAQKKIKNAVISPGSRSALLTIAFARHPDIKTFVIPDERSAAFIALGLAQQSNNPVALICTSGTAAINYYPAIAEAYYQNVPLLVLTADRPPEWIDQQDGQTIRQYDLYKNHIKHSYQLPDSYASKNDEWRAYRTVNDAINAGTSLPAGPVHINVPIREPFYPDVDEKISFDQNVPIIEQIQPQKDESLSDDILKQIGTFKRVLIVAGQQEGNQALLQLLNHVSGKHGIPVISDIISNTSSIDNAIRHHDVFLKHQDNSLQPDLLISFGRSVISKQLKLYLRKYRATEHWHLQHNDFATDTYQSLTKVFNINPVSFFKSLGQIDLPTNDNNYLKQWFEKDKIASEHIDSFFQNYPFGEFEAVKTILEMLPEGTTVHLANSMPVRYANFTNTHKKIRAYANRGTSGIDGCLSTAVGHALHVEGLQVLITGDMAFFYDRNALWHNHLPGNLLIIMLNNYGGGIFRLIDGPSQQPELDEYFETFQSLNAANTAKDFGLDYYFCNKREALTSVLPECFKTDKAKILEIETDKNINQDNYKSFNKTIKEKYGA